jgi:hypothetical protein
MNAEARRHAEAALAAVGRGDDYYRDAAREMRAAKDAGATWEEIGDVIGRGRDWCRRIVSWAESPANSGATTPWEPEAAVSERRLRHELQTAPEEQIERVVAGLPPERRATISRAIHETHPATVTRPPLGIRDEVRNMESAAGFHAVMSGSLARLEEAAMTVRDLWDEHADRATDDDRAAVEESIRDVAATLLALTSDPQELLR